jgi:protein gp37
MADKSRIEWTDATWNIITGCTLVDDGCRNCYAAHLIASWHAIGNHPSRKGLARKNAAGEAKFTGEVRFNEQWLDQPLRWKKPRRIFVCAHGDLFHESVPDQWIDRVFAVMALAPQHTFQVLTKRPERAAWYLSKHTRSVDTGLEALGITLASHARNPRSGVGTGVIIKATDINPGALQAWPLPNVWLGTSISDQASADLRIPHLLGAPAAVRFLSVEPMLGPVDLTEIAVARPDLRASVILDALRGSGGLNGPLGRLDWVICGGESGAKARPMHPDWARSLRDQCAGAGVAFFFKQWGEWVQASHDACPDADMSRNKAIWLGWNGEQAKPSCAGLVYPIGVIRIGKARAGRLLDGREWNQMPGTMRVMP